MPVFVLRPGAFRVEDADGPAEVPECPPTIQFSDYVERVVEPGQHHLRRGVLIGPKLPEVDAHPTPSEVAPRPEQGRKRRSVDDVPLAILERPGRQARSGRP